MLSAQIAFRFNLYIALKCIPFLSILSIRIRKRKIRCYGYSCIYSKENLFYWNSRSFIIGVESKELHFFAKLCKVNVAWFMTTDEESFLRPICSFRLMNVVEYYLYNVKNTFDICKYKQFWYFSSVYIAMWKEIR